MKLMHKTLFAAAVVGGLVAITVFDTKKSETAKTADVESLNMLRFKPDEVVKVEILPRVGEPTILEKKNDQWQLTSPVNDPADNQEVRNFLMSMNAEKTREVVAEGDEVKLEVYGLDSAPYGVKFTAADGKTETIKIGGVKAYDESLYAQIDDEKKVRLVSATWDVILAKRLAEFRNKNLYRSQPAKPEKVTRLEIAQTSPGYPPKMVFTKTNDQWQVVEGDKSYPLSNDRVDAYIENVKALRAQDFHAENKSAPGILAKFNLKNPAIEVRFFDGDKKFFTLDLAAPDQRGDAYAVSSDFAQVVSIFKMAADPIARRSDDFFAKKLPFAFKPEEAAKISVVTPELQADFEKKDGKWTSPTGEAAKVPELLASLEKLETLRVFEAGPLKQADSKIVVSKADGTSLLSFEWGPERIEKAVGHRPEAKYILGKTEKTDRLLGIPARTIAGLNLASLAPPKKKKE